MKKLFAILLALVLCMGMIPNMVAKANAETKTDTWNGTDVATDFAGGSGTEDDPYRIETAAQLIYFRNQVNNQRTNYSGKCICLDADINLNNKDFQNPIEKNGTVHASPARLMETIIPFPV